MLNGADVNSVDSGMRSALLSACWQGHLVIADILLTAGASVNHQCGQVSDQCHQTLETDHYLMSGSQSTGGGCPGGSHGGAPPAATTWSRSHSAGESLTQSGVIKRTKSVLVETDNNDLQCNDSVLIFGSAFAERSFSV